MATITGLLPGDVIKLLTNYPENEVEWSTVSTDRTPIINKKGIVNVTTNPADKCFGAIDTTVKATLTQDEGCDLGSECENRIIVNPTFPTPDWCGPEITKWKREVLDFNVLENIFEGGCDETHIKNKVPTIRWTITYDGLTHIQENKPARELLCPNCQTCKTLDGNCFIDDCYNSRPKNGEECWKVLQTANRLDDFWNYVYGRYKRFTLYDYDTGEIWHNVRFESPAAVDHVHRRNAQSRTYNLIWRPCCESAPLGGTCATHGMMNYTRSEDEACCTFQVDPIANPENPNIINDPIPNGTNNLFFTHEICAEGGTEPYVSWEITKNDFPFKMNITSSATNSNCATFSGTPTAAGSYNFTVQVVDSLGRVDVQEFQWTVDAVAFLPVEIISEKLIGGSVNRSYNVDICAREGDTPYTNWALVAGTLPPGLTLGASGSPCTVIAGTPTTAGTYNFTVEVTDSSANTDTEEFTIEIAESIPPVITSVPNNDLPGTTTGFFYSYDICATNGTTPYVDWQIISGSLPTGLTLNSTGSPCSNLSGTISSSGNYTFTVQVTDSVGQIDTQEFNLEVQNASVPSITTTKLDDGAVGVSYSQDVCAVNGITPYSNWSIFTGSLPPGLSISSSGTPCTTITGTPTTAGNYNFTVRVIDANGADDSAGFSVEIFSTATAPVVTSASYPAAEVGVSYSEDICATGGTTPYVSWTVVSGSIPPGMNLTSVGTPCATLSGTPTTDGIYTFDVQVEDSNGLTDTESFALTVNPPATSPNITTTFLTPTEVGSFSAEDICAIDGVTPYASWSIVSGSLPPGMYLNTSITPGCVSVEGTPTVEGVYNFTIQVIDDVGQSDTQALTLTVNSAS